MSRRTSLDGRILTHLWLVTRRKGRFGSTEAIEGLELRRSAVPLRTGARKQLNSGSPVFCPICSVACYARKHRYPDSVRVDHEPGQFIDHNHGPDALNPS